MSLATDTPHELPALTRTYPSKGGDKSIWTEVTIRAGHEGPQTLRLFYDDDDDDDYEMRVIIDEGDNR